MVSRPEGVIHVAKISSKMDQAARLAIATMAEEGDILTIEGDPSMIRMDRMAELMAHDGVLVTDVQKNELWAKYVGLHLPSTHDYKTGKKR